MQIKEPFVLDDGNSDQAIGVSLLPTPNDRRSKQAAPFISKRLNYIIIPPFNIEGVNWLGASSIQLKLTYLLPTSFTIVDRTTPVNPNYLATIRYDIANVPVRFKLWEGIGELLYVPLYNGEKIPAGNFFIEIWNIASSTTLSNQLPPILTTSRVIKPFIDPKQLDLCNSFSEVGIDESRYFEGLDLTMLLSGWNPSTQFWTFDQYGNGTLENI